MLNDRFSRFFIIVYFIAPNLVTAAIFVTLSCNFVNV